MVDVRVKLVDQATNQSWEQTTNEDGFFEFRALPFGKYRVEVEHSGFIKQVVEDVALQVAQTESLKVRLQVGSVNESIIVQGDRGLLEASDATLSQVIDDKRLLELPINGRNVMQLVSLSAGVINGGRASATQRQANYGPAFSVGGQRDNTSVVLIDGMNNVDDSAREIVITTQNLDEDQVVASVEDSGTGLDPNAATRIFEPFYTTKSGGMGMGLSISRSIVESHGGRLWATANEGPGTTFHFTLPKHS